MNELGNDWNADETASLLFFATWLHEALLLRPSDTVRLDWSSGRIVTFVNGVEVR